MELTNEFRVGVPVDQAWSVLTDVERIAPCLPGAELQEVEGEEYRGVVKVKVGPITAQYKGKATFQEKDDTNHRAVLKAEGRDTRGAGNANATITATLVPDGDGTKVSVVTDLAITGKVAQFGRGVLADVSGKLLNQFVACLESTVLGDQATAAAAAPASTAAASGEPTATSAPPPPRPPAEPVDLLDVAGGSVAKRFAPLIGALFAIWLFIRRRKRRRRRRQG
ncbi:MAG TPA: SRPBCC family protein [Acidimicrobiales bacterium]|nr:SRPBCC family protein [Acidimicrobiales bacterium]